VLVDYFNGVNMNKKTTVYLADLANTKFGVTPSTVPLAIGYISAYVKSVFNEEVQIELFRTFESLYEALNKNIPDIIGCSWYAWNFHLTTNALKYIKAMHPKVLTVVGGANVSEKSDNCINDFHNFPCIDIMIPNEGEIPFVNLLNTYINNGYENTLKTTIPGVFSFDRTVDRLIHGDLLPLANDINIFPSPYLSGSLDKFINEGWVPMMQGSRGCPYRCAFCVSAKDSWKKVRAFDTSRIKEEIIYLKTKSKDRTIRFTD
jgi:anaerobic magnesium-protoporphyrin IX monomethyl ester cyclase